MFIENTTGNTAVLWKNTNFNEVHAFCPEAVLLRCATDKIDGLCEIWGEKITAPCYIFKNKKTGKYSSNNELPKTYREIKDGK